MFIVRTLVFVIYAIGLYLSWSIVKVNIEDNQEKADYEGKGYHINWFRELGIGALIWVFTPVWMVGFIVIAIRCRFLKR